MRILADVAGDDYSLIPMECGNGDVMVKPGVSPRVGGGGGGEGGRLLAAAAQAVLLGVRGVVLERAQDGLWDGRRRGQVRALRAEAALVRRVGDGVLHAVGARVRVGALRHLRLQVTCV
ncbi:Protein of unknown function [Gryllus bimaculatus]|nr:Protein of unknown function [Gryllus bimaculatus]